MNDDGPAAEQAKEIMRAPWVAGDFGALAREIGTSEADAFTARVHLQPGARVLDVACGTGNATLPLARRGFMVTGLDMTPKLLEEARTRAAQEALDVRFDEGFAENLPYADSSFDAVLSMFGIMFSPRPESVVEEIARVLKCGGQLALANWTPSGFGGQMSALVGRYLPAPPPGTASPFMWGDVPSVIRRLETHFENLETSVVRIPWELKRTAVDSAQFFARNTGPLQLALARLETSDQDALMRDFERLWVNANEALEVDRTLITTEYLEVRAIRR